MPGALRAIHGGTDRIQHRIDVGRRWRCGPSEKRSELRACVGEAPIASSTCDGCATPAEQADPVEHSIAARVEQHQQRVALAAGKGQVRDAGQPARTDGR